jgi:hypothetical protein
VEGRVRDAGVAEEDSGRVAEPAVKVTGMADGAGNYD